MAQVDILVAQPLGLALVTTPFDGGGTSTFFEIFDEDDLTQRYEGSGITYVSVSGQAVVPNNGVITSTTITLNGQLLYTITNLGIFDAGDLGPGLIDVSGPATLRAILLGGSDVINGSAGNDLIEGFAGSDTASYASAPVLVSVDLGLATAQNTGGGGTDTLSSIENLTGSAFNDTLLGNASNNVLQGGPGNDTLNGIGGSDTASYADATGAVSVNLNLANTAQNTGGAGIDTLISIENLTGSAFGDVLAGNAGDNVLDGKDGLDTVTLASIGAGVIVNLALGGPQANGGTGSDTYVSIENLIGTAFADTLTGNSGANVLEGGAGNDTLNGGDGSDTASYASATGAVSVNLRLLNAAQNTGGAGADTLISIENLIGSAFNDTITGDAGNNNPLQGLGGADTIFGGAGNDWIDGESGNDALAMGHVAGNDTLHGEAGDDVVLAGAGDDVAYGGAGTDFLVGELGNDLLYGQSEWDAIDGRQGSDVLYGEGGADIIFGDGYFYLFGFSNDSLFGGDDNDIMMGEAGEPSMDGAGDAIHGEGGNDLLDGGGGNDAIYGGAGDDVIDGDHGNDYIVGGPGAEVMLGSNAVAYGGPTQGSDLFVYQSLADAGDLIFGFDTRPGENDGIDLRALFDAFGYAGTTPRAAGTNLMSVIDSAGNALVLIDPDGAPGPQGFTTLVTLMGVSAASVTDAVFLFQ